jgi:hypothetical protein
MGRSNGSIWNRRVCLWAFSVSSDRKAHKEPERTGCFRSELQSRLIPTCDLKAASDSETGEIRMKNKLMISQSIFWAAAILVVAIVEDAQNVVPILAVLATVAMGSLNNFYKKLS